MNSREMRLEVATYAGLGKSWAGLRSGWCGKKVKVGGAGEMKCIV